MPGSFAPPWPWSWVAAAAALLAAAGVAAGAVPVLEAPGYELALLGSLLAAVLGAPLGISAARRQLARPEPSAAAAFASAAAVLSGLLAVLLSAVAVRTALASPCSATAGAGLFPVLAFPSALVAAALGTAAGFAARGRRLAAALLYLLAAAGSLAATLLAAHRGPGSYLLDPLLGAWPGPLYDEAVPLDGRLLLHGLSAVALAGALASAAALGLALARRGRRRAPAAVALAASLAAMVAVRGAMVARGDLASRGDVSARLGGHRPGARCELHFPREKDPWEAERLLRQCELDATEVAAALGLSDPPRVRVFLYRDEGEKRRFTGAGRTAFTKPWLGEIHLADEGAFHPVLRHELVHALAAGLARGPLRVPARRWIWVRMGLVEGLAVALEPPRGEFTVHEWTRAMRDLGLLPAASTLLEPSGFLATAPARAYTAAGSFLAFLLERYGPAPVGRLYGGAGFAAAFGRPLEALESEWSAFLDLVPAPPGLQAAAEARFRTGSLFARRCAREVAGIEAMAAHAARAGRAGEAAAAWRRAADLSGDPSDLRAAGDALRRGGALAAAGAAYREVLARTGESRPALRTSVHGALGDLAWLEGDRAGAEAHYRTALALAPERGEARLLLAKRAALSDAGLAEAAGPWLLQAGDPALALARLSGSPSPLASYLLGRAALARGAPRLAVGLLERAASRGLPDPALEVEARRLLAESRCGAGDFDGGAAGFAALEREATRAADRQRAAEGARRCRLERDLLGAPPPGPSDWPRRVPATGP